ncbi:oligosaccharide flippase family protein [Pacificimonas flava]|uniref:Lipopolysaccharide biosynthesis protein WzxC n=1 Tax=Pacificimonas flava TaxID=1234595 RepID=M2TRL9_9SPHN|nr:oligosaccharide flippase family protein [Pacificimonas flava]EMD84421.1 Lipopolysaccharide biosynthesis protein WzxC [Pacificimonas flava]MBB5279707.1 O-antigen/teichoic acid export membrane protein [Pacificimonas flava]
MFEERSDRDLGARALVAAGFVFMTSLVTRLGSLVNLAVLGRLLSPSDYGVASLAFMAIGFIQTFIDVRMGAALMTFKRIEDAHINTAFTLQLLRGLLIAGILFAVSGLVADMLNEPRLQLVLQVLSGVLIIDGFKNPAFLLYARHLDFSREFFRTTVANLIGFAVSIAAAFYFQSYWAIVVATMFSRTMECLLTYYKVPVRPRFGLGEWRSMVSFGSGVLVVDIFTQIHSMAPQSLISRLISTAAVGQFTMGQNAYNTLLGELVAPIRKILLPGFGAVREDLERLRRTLRLSQEVIFAIAMPIGVGLSFFAHEAIAILVGDQWDEAILVVQVIAPVAAARTIATPAHSAVMALERLRPLLARATASLAVGWPLIFAGIHLAGFSGAIYAWAAVTFIGLFLSLQLVGRELGVHIRHVAKDCGRAFLSCGVMAAFLWILKPRIIPVEDVGDVIAGCLPFVLLGGIIYFACLFGLWILQGRPAGFEMQVLHYGGRSIPKLTARMRTIFRRPAKP